MRNLGTMTASYSLRDRLKDTPLLTYLRATGVLMGLGLLLKLLAALHQAILAALYGVGPELDAYFAAIALPNVLITFVILGPMGLALIPGIVGGTAREETEMLPSFAASVFTIVVLLSVVFVAIGYVAAPLIMGWQVPGFAPQTTLLAVDLFRLVLPAVGLATVNALFRGIFHAYQQFSVPTTAYILSELVFLAVLVALSPLVGIHAAAGGMLMGAVVAFLWQWWLLFRKGIAMSFVWPSWHAEFGTILAPLCLIGLAMAAYQSSGLWARLYASELGPGSVTLLNYGLNFDKVVGGLVAVSAATAAYPTMVARVGHERVEVLRGLQRGLRGVLLTSLPLVMVVVALRVPFVRFWLERGRFGAEDSAVVSALVALLAPGLLAGALSYPLLYAFHATGRLRAPAVVCVLGTLVGAAVGFLLRGLWGLEGIAVALSACSCGITLTLFFVLCRQAPGLWDLRSMQFTAKVAFAAGLAALVADLHPTGVPSWFALGLGAGGGALVYGMALLLLRVEEAEEAWRWLRGASARLFALPGNVSD